MAPRFGVPRRAEFEGKVTQGQVFAGSQNPEVRLLGEPLRRTYAPRPQPLGRVGAVRFGTVRFGTVRFGTVRFGLAEAVSAAGEASCRSSCVIASRRSVTSKTRLRFPKVPLCRTPAAHNVLTASFTLDRCRPTAAAAVSTVKMGRPGKAESRRSAAEPRRGLPAAIRHCPSSSSRRLANPAASSHERSSSLTNLSTHWSTALFALGSSAGAS